MPSVLKQLEGRGWDQTPIVVGLACLAFAGAVPLGVAAAVRPTAATRATASCDSTETQPFRRWADTSHYVLIPGGAVETGSNTWRLKRGAQLVLGNEPFHVHRLSDNESLSLPP